MNNNMRFLFIFLAVLSMVAPAHAGLESYSAIGGAFRFDNLSWSTSEKNNPSITQENAYDNLGIFQLQAQANAVWNRKIFMRGALDYGWIYRGKHEGDFYDGQDEQAQINSDTGGNVIDGTIGLGYMFRVYDSFVNRSVYLVPLVGYSANIQNLEITDGKSATGQLSALDSTYDSEWYGPWLGLDASFEATDRSDAVLRLEYHWADFYAESDANLRDDLAHPKSFTQWADAQGYLLNAAFRHIFARQWVMGMEVNYQYWWSDSGTHKNYYSNGTSADATFNGANWNTFGIMFTVGYFSGALF